MSMFVRLFDLVSGRPLPVEEDGPAHRLQLMLHALLASIVFAAIYGLAAGSTDLGLALANLYKVPMVIVLSALASVPIALFAWKVAGSGHRCTDLLMGMASGTFTGSLVLAVLAPVVALYYHTSGWLGGAIAIAAFGLATVFGIATMWRAVWNRIPENLPILQFLVPVTMMAMMHFAVMVQLIHVASPILPEVTVFDGGMDALVGQ